MNKHSCKTHRRNHSCTKRPQPHPPHRRGTFHRRLQPLCNIHGIWVAIHGIWVAKFTTLESCWQEQYLVATGLGSSWWQAQYLAGTWLGSSWWQARDLAHVGGRHSTWLKLVAGTVLGRNMTWLKLVAGTVLARNVTWLMLVAGTVLGRNMTWLMLVAGHCYLAATGLGSSWWQAQYLAGTWLGSCWWQAQYSVGERLESWVQVRSLFCFFRNLQFFSFEIYKFSQQIYHKICSCQSISFRISQSKKQCQNQCQNQCIINMSKS